jgi:hypothetical protein
MISAVKHGVHRDVYRGYKTPQIATSIYHVEADLSREKERGFSIPLGFAESP